MKAPKKKDWKPPGKDCGACGAKTCEEFTGFLKEGIKEEEDCPFYNDLEDEDSKILPEEKICLKGEAVYGDTDILNKPFDFILLPFKGEPSARKIVLPFRPDLTEKWEIKKGDIVLGRPMGAGCPVQHILSVIDADYVTGVLTCHVVSPLVARNNPEKVKDIKAYHMLGFEGIAKTAAKKPKFGHRQRFLPGYCMMNLGHTGLVNMVIERDSGTHVRVEDVIIL
ncbi:Fe-S cluster protein [Methanoplanus sp. FWC-SCC4]|uniref:Fe-S cluster protein n=1 Tax=Methanochimaera problematica TaxID=2609417 RepID=A0AA97I504_9EURY|nr:(Fe-S)-binding protein [Methanoplanus sp. FWC-SCC4]WOF16936.1 Fe-S cluster protein [Methanoplanus sp. FWC-SCC4]